MFRIVSLKMAMRGRKTWNYYYFFLSLVEYLVKFVYLKSRHLVNFCFIKQRYIVKNGYLTWMFGEFFNLTMIFGEFCYLAMIFGKFFNLPRKFGEYCLFNGIFGEFYNITRIFGEYYSFNQEIEWILFIY